MRFERGSRSTLVGGQFAAAWMLLSRIPLPLAAGDRTRAAEAVWAFPLAGAAVGALAGAVFWMLAQLGLPAIACSALALGAMALATGALHEDGLADTMDGWGGGRTREEKLAIMRDGRIGAFGAMALIVVFAAGAGALAALGPATGLAALIAAAAISRALAALPLMLLPPARADGLGHAAGRPSAAASAAAFLIAGAIALAALWAAADLRSASTVTTVAFAAALISVLVLGAIARRQIGGSTGDVLGAAIKLAETAALCAIAAVAR
jgi:adenosylcobinamide-GDP ribazoletransferase